MKSILPGFAVAAVRASRGPLSACRHCPCTAPRRARIGPALIGIVLSLALQSSAHTRVRGANQRLDAFATILDAFRDHDIVAVDEPHGDEAAHAFRTALVRHPRFPAVANDILVEFGNSRYQALIDRFVAGERVAEAELAHVWQDTTMAGMIWDRPIYEEFFRSVRAVNAILPATRKVRVLLGDPPIDWAAIRTVEDFARARRAYSDRSAHAADVLVRETLSRRRRALVIYGGLHLIRQNAAGPNLIEHVEKTGARAFVVLTHPLASLDALRVDYAGWPAPSAALTAGTSLANQADAVLYLGPASARKSSPLTPRLCADRGYREMRVARMTLAGVGDAPAQLERECAATRRP